MSLARLNTTAKVRKDWVCEKCKSPIRKGIDGRISYSVGFRGLEHTRCTRSECRPRNSELESSLVSEVYSAIEGIFLSDASSLDDIHTALQEISDACESVASEYESVPMYDINSDLQERADTLHAAGDELASWEAPEEEPQEHDFNSSEEFEEAHDEWIESAVESALDTITSLDLP